MGLDQIKSYSCRRVMVVIATPPWGTRHGLKQSRIKSQRRLNTPL
jgi:hypothetical protein